MSKIIYKYSDFTETDSFRFPMLNEFINRNLDYPIIYQSKTLILNKILRPSTRSRRNQIYVETKCGNILHLSKILYLNNDDLKKVIRSNIIKKVIY